MIRALCKIAEPGYGMITNIGKAHLEGFGGIEGVKKGKGEMYQFIKSTNGLIFINNDNNVLLELLSTYSKKVTYGSISVSDVSGQAVLKEGYLKVNCVKPFSIEFKTNLTGLYNFENVLSAIAIGDYFKVKPEEIKSAIEFYFPANQRSQIINKSNKVAIILDAYNANPSSMSAALDNFNTAFNGYKIVALGDMLELGIESEKEHHAIGDRLKKLNFDKVILVGTEFKEIAKKFGFLHFANTADASKWFAKNNFRNCTLLIKGSRGIKMELIVDVFQ